MDESLVTRPDTSQAKRPRVVIGGDSYSSGLAEPLATAPTGTEVAVPVRQVGKIQVEGVVGGIPLPVDITIGDTVTTNQGTPNSDANSWPVHQVGAAPLPTGAATSALQISGNASLASIDGKIPASPSQEHVTAASPHAARLSDGLGFYKATTPADTQPTSNASGSQVDGHSASIGSTTDLDTADTVIGRLKQIIARLAGGLPAALVGGRLDTNLGAWLGSAAPTVGQKTAANSLPVVIASDQEVNVDVGAPDQSSFTYGSSIEQTVGGVFQDTAPTLTAGQTGAVRLTSQRALHQNLRDAAGAELATAGNPARVDPTGTTTQPISAAALPLPAGAATSALQTAGNASLASIDADIDTALSSRNAEATQLLIKAKTDNLDALLSSRAAAATQTDGTQRSIARGGTKGATTPADVTSTAEGADHQAIDAQIYHGGAAIDPRAIRALTASDIVTADQGAAAAVAGAWPTKITDGVDTAGVTAAGALQVDGSAVTQPISAVALPLPAGAATSANQTTIGNQTTKINDGTNTMAVKAASTAAVAADPSAVIALSPNSPLPTGTNIIGALSANQSVNVAQVGGSATATIAAGEQRVGAEGVGASGAALSGNPVQIGASDGTNLQVPRVFDADTGAGTQYVAGVSLRKSASGGSVEAGTSIDPLRVDPTGTTTQPVSDAGGSLTVDTPQLPAALVGGRLDANVGAIGGSAVTTQAAGEQLVAVEGRAADGAAVVGNPVLIAGQDGANAQSLLTDSSGRPNVVGAAAQGAAVAGNPFLVAGEDGSGNVARLQERTTAIVGTEAGLVTRNIPTATGTHANAWSAAAVGAGGTSASIDTQFTPNISVFGNTDGATTITVQLSQDDANFYDATSTLVTGAGDFALSATLGARYVRLKSSQARTITATIAGKG